MSIEIRLKLAKRIKQLRKINNFTQEKLAELSGVSYENVQKMESKTPHGAQLDTLVKIAKAFKMSVSELLDFTHGKKK